MKTILVPIDFSEVSDHAIDMAFQIAEKSESEITLLHIIDHPNSSSINTMGIVDANLDPMESIFIKKMIEISEEKMTVRLEKGNAAGLAIQSKMKIGNPYKEITEQIVETKCDVLIMGTKGTDGFAEELIGSNAERVIRNSKVPVITVKEKCQVCDIHKIAVASSFNNIGDEFVNRLHALQNSLEAELAFVKINTPGNFQTTKKDKKIIEDFAKEHNFKDYTIDVYNDLTEEDGIVSFAEEIDADMIAMGTHGRTGVMHLILGSIAEDVANHAKRPVWTFNIRK